MACLQGFIILSWSCGDGMLVCCLFLVIICWQCCSGHVSPERFIGENRGPLNSQELLAWLTEEVNLICDHQPDRNRRDLHGVTKTELLGRATQQLGIPVSKATFFRMWKRPELADVHFPRRQRFQLLVLCRYLNFFILMPLCRCTTCVILQRQLQKCMSSTPGFRAEVQAQRKQHLEFIRFNTAYFFLFQGVI